MNKPASFSPCHPQSAILISEQASDIRRNSFQITCLTHDNEKLGAERTHFEENIAGLEDQLEYQTKNLQQLEQDKETFSREQTMLEEQLRGKDTELCQFSRENANLFQEIQKKDIDINNFEGNFQGIFSLNLFHFDSIFITKVVLKYSKRAE